MKRCSSLCAPKAPKAHPAAERTNVRVIGIPSPSVNGLRNPAEEPPIPENGLSDEMVKAPVMMRRLTNISRACDTSVLDTAMNPPIMV